MSVASVKVDSAALAVAANNALAFIPANSQVKLARVRLTEDRVEFTATDTYCAGRDSAECEYGPPEPLEMLVTRECLQGLDSTGRKDKKGIGTLRVVMGDGLMFTPEDKTLASENHVCMTAGNDSILDLFDAVDEMLENEQPFRTAFQPQVLQKFSKVKADKDERIADFAIEDPNAPVLVKIGTSFKGVIMPVNRDAHSELVGEEGLW